MFLSKKLQANETGSMHQIWPQFKGVEEDMRAEERRGNREVENTTQRGAL